MDPAFLEGLFHPDFCLNAPNGARMSKEAIIEAITQKTWPLLKPGTIQADIEFLPIGDGDVPDGAINYPKDELLRFRATLKGLRLKPDENGSLEFHHQVANVWHIVNDQCKETWPSFDESKNDEDVMKIIHNIDSK